MRNLAVYNSLSDASSASPIFCPAIPDCLDESPALALGQYRVDLHLIFWGEREGIDFEVVGRVLGAA